MGKRSRGNDRVHLVVAVVVERHVDKGIVCEPKDDVADVVRLRLGQRSKDPFDPVLVLVGRLGGPIP